MQPRMDKDNDEEIEIVDEVEHVILAATEACKSLDSGRSETFTSEPKSDRKEVGVQTVSMDNKFLCNNCKCKNLDEVKEINDGSDLQLVRVNESPLVGNNSKQIVPKAIEKGLAGAKRQEMVMEEFCTKQHTEIMRLDRLLQQSQWERECNSIINSSWGVVSSCLTH